MWVARENMHGLHFGLLCQNSGLCCLGKLLSVYHLVWCFVVHEDDQGEDGDHGEDQEPDV